MNKDPIVFMKHILESIEIIENTIENLEREDFLKKRATQDICIYRLQVIGEAAKNIPQEIQQKYKEIPWKDMAATRDKLVHNYFGVDLDICWIILKIELPKIKKYLQKTIEKENKK